MAWTTPRDWTDGELVTEALLDTHLRDNLLALTTWTSYTPTWTSTGTPLVGNGTLAGKYIQAGDLCHFWFRLTVGSTTDTEGVGYAFGLPVVAAGHGVAMALGLTTSYYVGLAAINSGSSTVALAQNGSGFTWGESVPATWSTGHTITVSGTYEI